MTAEEYLENIKSQNKASGYITILPAPVRYSNEISSFEKILYSEIVSSAKTKCISCETNDYFAKVLKVSKDRISRSINKLKYTGFIDTEIIYEPNSKKILGRAIYITNKGGLI